jgi:hypothetical protein
VTKHDRGYVIYTAGHGESDDSHLVCNHEIKSSASVGEVSYLCRIAV